MATFGTRLKERREKRGISLDAISESTKIPRHYLEAVERADLAHLPGSAFNKGFVRAYAQFVGLDPDEMAEAYLQEERAQGLEAPSDREIADQMSRALARSGGDRGEGGVGAWIRRGLLVVPVVGLLGVAGWYFFLREVDGVPPSPPPARAQATQESSVTPRPVPEESPATQQPPAPPPPPAGEDPGAARISITDSGVGADVVDHQLLGRADHFAAGTGVCFWTRVVGGESGDIIRHVWRHEGRVVQSLEIILGGSPWRIYTRKRPFFEGNWSVEATDAEGRVLARAEFVAGPPARD